MTKEKRSKLLVLQHPVAPEAPLPFCKWCGEAIQYTKIASKRRRSRAYHRGDKYELAVGKRKRNCRKEFRDSFVWSARDALRWQSFRKHGKVDLRCIDCNIQVETGKTLSKQARRERAKWDADHDTALIDGGPHELENFKCRCVPCHKIKTKEENARRRHRKS